MRKVNDEQIDGLVEEIKALSKEVASLKGERDAITERRKLETSVSALREELETLRIEKDRKDEEHAKKVREVEHATGLHRKQAEWDAKKAVDEARITVREENLSADKQRFDEQMEFHKQQIKTEVDRLEKLLTSLMERLPTVTVEKAIDLHQVPAARKAAG